MLERAVWTRVVRKRLPLTGLKTCRDSFDFCNGHDGFRGGRAENDVVVVLITPYLHFAEKAAQGGQSELFDGRVPLEHALVDGTIDGRRRSQKPRDDDERFPHFFLLFFFFRDGRTG